MKGKENKDIKQCINEDKPSFENYYWMLKIMRLITELPKSDQKTNLFTCLHESEVYAKFYIVFKEIKK